MEPENGSFFVVRGFDPRGFILEYISPFSVPYFKECSSVVEAEGYTLIELQVVPQKGSVHVSAVIACKDPKKDVGVADCSKAHHALQPKLLSLLNKTEDELYMEVGSPGLERNFKNAAEFSFFTGREVRVWDKKITDWVRGIIESSDESQVNLKLEDGSIKTVAYADIAKAKFIHL